MDYDFVSVHVHAKKNSASIQPCILTSHLVNNPYLFYIAYNKNEEDEFSRSEFYYPED